jgi:hypothetical protein
VSLTAGLGRSEEPPEHPPLIDGVEVVRHVLGDVDEGAGPAGLLGVPHGESRASGPGVTGLSVTGVCRVS